MTDALVKVNGQQAGDIHQGAFYEFSYNITNLIQPGKTNTLEVEVAKESQNRSINAAERKADWWTFGGIYRPVYIKAMPEYNISNIAVDAKADGSLRGKVFTSDIPKDYIIEMEINPAGAKGKFPKQSIIVNGGTEHPVIAKWDKIDAWEPENPNLYDLTVTLKNDKKKTVHQHTERIGFRTIDFRRKDGFYLNGTKLVMKGINRHSFHPDGGRTTNKEISIRDGQLMKEMNMNAVRFHYPPDRHFLDVCDSLGILVLDELCGLQNGYDATVAPKLLTEMIKRDVNRPSIIIWDNGNEGGWSRTDERRVGKEW